MTANTFLSMSTHYRAKFVVHNYKRKITSEQLQENNFKRKKAGVPWEGFANKLCGDERVDDFCSVIFLFSIALEGNLSQSAE